MAAITSPVATETRRRTFPTGFAWGVATASYQIEGAATAGGRGPSIWDVFSRTPGRTHNGDTGDVACDHYERLEGDLDLMAELGLTAYRFSVAWPRIRPDGSGAVNRVGLDFYRRLVDGLRAREIAPVATLYHWDLPQALEEAGGWTNRDTAERFAEYAAVVGEAIGDGVERWITLNEPWCSAWLGYGRGTHAPGRRDVAAALSATHHLLLGHGKAVAALRSVGAGEVGITLNLADVSAASDHPDDLGAARRTDGQHNRLYLDPLFRAAYPDDMVEHYAPYSGGLDVAADGDLALIGAPVDFLGVNFYSPTIVADPGRLAEARSSGFSVGRIEHDAVIDDLRATAVRRPTVERTAMGWEIEAPALTRLLARVANEYGPIPIYVTENGAAFSDYVDPAGRVVDQERIDYLEDHVAAVLDAMDTGADVRGYFVWSLLDNFEWALGYSRRFGLVWVDYPTGERIRKDSFGWYRKVVERNGLDVAGAS